MLPVPSAHAASPIARDEFEARRAAFFATLGGDAALVLGEEVPGRGEGEHRYVASPDLYWLTGWEGEGAALLRPGADQPYVLFVPPRSARQEAVTGRRPGLDEAVTEHGADAAFPLSELDERLPTLCLGYVSLHYGFGRDPQADARVLGTLRRDAAVGPRNGLAAPRKIVDARLALAELRARKSPAELDLLRRAGAISAEAHLLAMGTGRAGVHEYELEALVDGTFRRRGGGTAYASIVGAGANGTVVHYTANRGTLREGQLCLVDAGCRLGHYATDVTRTWPVGGRFEGPGRALYEVVLAAWKAAVEQVRPGRSWPDVHDAAVGVLCEGLVELGLLDGSAEDARHEQRYRRFYAHEIGHWLGLEVHEPAPYFEDGRPRAFEPRQVLAVEPGLYVGADDLEAPEAFRGIGVRIEDDLVVTEGAPEILTAGCPREIGEVEGACR